MRTKVFAFHPCASVPNLWLKVLLCIVAGSAIGCSAPSKANIELRKQNANLESRIDVLQRQHDADAATIRGLEAHATTVPVLPSDRLASLFTVHGLKFKNLTGIEGRMLKIYIVPIDGTGEPIKAAGAFSVDAFDLAKPGNVRIGHWDFPLSAAAKNWFGNALLYNYMLPCPLSKPPPDAGITIRIQFTDALTQRVFVAQRVVKE